MGGTETKAAIRGVPKPGHPCGDRYDSRDRFRFLPGNYYHDHPGRYGLIQTRAEMERMGRDPEYLVRMGMAERVD